MLKLLTFCFVYGSLIQIILQKEDNKMKMNKLHKSLKNHIILILILTMLTSSLCGCSMIFGEEAPEDKEREVYTEYGLSYEVPKDFHEGSISLASGGSTSAWANVAKDPDFYYAVQSIDANEIDIETFNWISTGYYSGQITYMGETITISPDFLNPSVESTEKVTINGNSGYKTEVSYELKESEKLTPKKEVIYVIQIEDTIAYIVFCSKTAKYKEYAPLIDAVMDSLKLA